MKSVSLNPHCPVRWPTFNTSWCNGLAPSGNTSPCHHIWCYNEFILVFRKAEDYTWGIWHTLYLCGNKWLYIIFWLAAALSLYMTVMHNKPILKVPPHNDPLFKCCFQKKNRALTYVKTEHRRQGYLWAIHSTNCTLRFEMCKFGTQFGDWFLK